jgi:hypothetical protein
VSALSVGDEDDSVRFGVGDVIDHDGHVMPVTIDVR